MAFLFCYNRGVMSEEPKNYDGSSVPPQNPAPQNQAGSGRIDPPANQQGGSVSPQPPVNLDARTMASDIKSIQESGGSFPRPYAPQPPSKEEKQEPMPQPKEEGGRKEQVFTPPPAQPPQQTANSPFPPRSSQQPPQQPPQKPQTPPQQIPEPIPPTPKSGKKGLFVGLIVFLIIVGLAAVGYFFVYPLFQSDEAVVVPSVTPSATEETPTVIPEETSAEELTPASTSSEPSETATSTPPESTTPEPELGAHVSPFKQVPDLKPEVSIATFSTSALHTVLQFDAVETPVFREVIIKDAGDKLLTTRRLMTILAPQTFDEATQDLFSLDPTIFVYTNSAGSWPGVILALEDGVSLETTKQKISVLEQQNEIPSFFLADPGTPGTWADGKAGTLPYRYLDFGNGARFHYLWLGNSLIFSTSYDGFKAALNRL